MVLTVIIYALCKISSWLTAHETNALGVSNRSKDQRSIFDPLQDAISNQVDHIQSTHEVRSIIGCLYHFCQALSCCTRRISLLFVVGNIDFLTVFWNKVPYERLVPLGHLKQTTNSKWNPPNYRWPTNGRNWRNRWRKPLRTRRRNIETPSGMCSHNRLSLTLTRPSRGCPFPSPAHPTLINQQIITVHWPPERLFELE